MKKKQNIEAFKIKLAGTVIKIQPLYAYIREYCKEYLTEEQEQFTVRSEYKDIEFERQKSENEDIKQGVEIRVFTDEYFETLSVYRKIAERLIVKNIILFHGSVIAVDGIGYLFTAKSGTGKSTHTRLWMEQFGNRAVMINDDKPLLEVTEQGVVVHGTPWAGKHNLNTNCTVPLKGICVLERAKTNAIKSVSGREIYAILLQQVYRPMNTSGMLQTMQCIDKLMEKTEFYKLGCNMESDAAIVAYQGMNL